jgi:hypothetical protein
MSAIDEWRTRIRAQILVVLGSGYVALFSPLRHAIVLNAEEGRHGRREYSQDKERVHD